MMGAAICLLVVALFVGSAAVVGALIDSEEGPSTSPASDPFPSASPRVAEQSLDYLELGGAELMTMHEAALALPQAADEHHCSTVAQALDRTAPSPDVMRKLTALRDQPLQAAFDQERRALGVALTTCISPAPRLPPEAVRADLTEASDLVSERLSQLQEAR